MDWRSVTYDWNQVRAFLVTAEEGSFSAAGRALGLTQPTLGRQVAALEDRLGVTLFERVGRTLALTDSGLELLEHVRAMGDAAGRISLIASGRSQSVEGHVRITSTDAMAMHLLPEAIREIRDTAPGVTLEIIAANEVRDLRRREADIAIRHARPEQPDLIARFLRDMPVRLYAASAYLDALGRPTTPEGFADAVFIGFDQSDRLPARLAEMGYPPVWRDGRIISESSAVVWQMVRDGLGISIMAEEVAERVPGLERVLPDLHSIPVPVWLVTHRELRTSRRIRLVYDILARRLARRS